MTFGRTQIGVNLWASLKRANAPFLNAPENLTQQTGSFIVGDAVGLTVQTDDSDSLITLDVELYANDVLLASMSQWPEGTWKYEDEDIPAGVRTYRAKRIVSGGGIDSSDQPITSLDVLAPDEVTSATCLCWVRTVNGESIRMGGTFERQGGATVDVTVTSSTSLDGRDEELFVDCVGAGALGVSLVDVYLNGALLLNDVATAANVAVTGTDLTLHFSAATYSTAWAWRNVVSGLLDLTGNANHFLNTASGTTRPYLEHDGALGTVCAQFDGVNKLLTCTTSLANDLVGGTNKSFQTFALVYITAMPGGASNATLWSATNPADADIPLVEHVARNTGAVRIWNVQRRSDTGVAVTVTSTLPSTVQGHLCQYAFDGASATVGCDTADMIGGVSDVSGAQTLATAITPTRVTMAARNTSSGTTGYANIQAYEYAFFDSPLSDVENIQHQRYYNTLYPNLPKLKANRDVNLTLSGFGGGYQGKAAQYWWGGGVSAGDMVPADNSEDNDTQFGWRQNVFLDASIVPDFGWYYQNTGDLDREQRIIEEWIDEMADAGVTTINFLYYSRQADLVSYNGLPASEKIFYWFDKYNSARNKNRLKFVLMGISLYASFDANSATFQPVTPGTWLNLPTMADYWASLMLDPQYLRDQENKPFFLLYNTSAEIWTTTRTATIDTAVANAGITEGVRYVQMNHDSTQATALSAELGAYGPNSMFLSPFAQYAYKAQMDRDISVNQSTFPNAFRNWVGMTFFTDARAINNGTLGYEDLATYTEAEAHTQRTFSYSRCFVRTAMPDNMVYGYAAMEHGEGGCFFPYRDMKFAANTPTRGVWLEAVKNVKRAFRPSEYDDVIHADSKNAAVTRPSGTWTIVNNINNGGGGAPAPYLFREHRSSSAGARWKVAPPMPVTRIVLYGPKGAAYGGFNATTDGGAPTAVVQTDASTTYDNVLYDTGVLALALHNIEITQTAGLVSLERCRWRVER